MSLFPVTTANLCAFDTSATEPTDVFRNGIRMRSNGAVKAVVGGVHVNYGTAGLSLDANGAVRINDSSILPPEGTVYNNCLPIAPDGTLCVDGGAENDPVSFNHGMPYSAVGAIAGVVA